MSGFLRLLFIVYCVEVGLFLVVAPWTGLWSQLMAPYTRGVEDVLFHPLLRGAVTGFGLVHVVWGAHDSLFWLQGRRSGGSLRT